MNSIASTLFLASRAFRLLIVSRPATVAQHVAHPLVVGEMIGSNLGPTPRHNYCCYVRCTTWIAQNRHNSLPCTVERFRQRSCNQRIGCLMGVNLFNILCDWAHNTGIQNAEYVQGGVERTCTWGVTQTPKVHHHSFYLFRNRHKILYWYVFKKRRFSAAPLCQGLLWYWE